MLPSNLPTVIAYLVGNYKNILHNPHPQTATFRNVTLPSSCNTIKRHSRTAAKAESGTLQNRAEKPRKSIIFLLAVSASRACDKSAQRARKHERRGVCILPYETQMKLIIILEDCLNGKHSNEGQPQRRVTKVTKVTVTFSKMKLKTSEITFILYIII